MISGALMVPLGAFAASGDNTLQQALIQADAQTSVSNTVNAGASNSTAVVQQGGSASSRPSNICIPLPPTNASSASSAPTASSTSSTPGSGGTSGGTGGGTGGTTGGTGGGTGGSTGGSGGGTGGSGGGGTTDVGGNGSGGGSGGGTGGGGSPSIDEVAPPSQGGGEPPEEELPEVPGLPNAGAGIIPFAGVAWLMAAVFLARSASRGTRRPTVRMFPHD